MKKFLFCIITFFFTTVNLSAQSNLEGKRILYRTLGFSEPAVKLLANADGLKIEEGSLKKLLAEKISEEVILKIALGTTELNQYFFEKKLTLKNSIPGFKTIKRKYYRLNVYRYYSTGRPENVWQSYTYSARDIYVKRLTTITKDEINRSIGKPVLSKESSVFWMEWSPDDSLLYFSDGEEGFLYSPESKKVEMMENNVYPWWLEYPEFLAFAPELEAEQYDVYFKDFQAFAGVRFSSVVSSDEKRILSLNIHGTTIPVINEFSTDFIKTRPYLLHCLQSVSFSPNKLVFVTLHDARLDLLSGEYSCKELAVYSSAGPDVKKHVLIERPDKAGNFDFGCLAWSRYGAFLACGDAGTGGETWEEQPFIILMEMGIK